MKYLAMATASCLVLALSGCGGDGDGGTINPTTGIWLFVPGDVFDNSCEITDPPTDPVGDFTITSTGEGTFTVNDGTNVFDCTVSGSSFDCPRRSVETIDGNPYYDAVGDIQISVHGTFQSATEASGHQTGHLSCTGTDCDNAEMLALAGVSGFPCEVSERFTASYTGG